MGLWLPRGGVSRKRTHKSFCSPIFTPVLLGAQISGGFLPGSSTIRAVGIDRSSTDGIRETSNQDSPWMPHLAEVAHKSPVGFLLEALFNKVVTHIPVLRLRLAWLKMLGATIEPGAVVFCGTQVINASSLHIGERSSIGSRTYLDARGGIHIGHDVNVGSDTHLITADHDLTSPGFEERYSPIRLEDYASLGTRSLILRGVTVGRGSGVAAGAVVNRDVRPSVIVGGVPAKEIGTRPTDLSYRVMPPPRLA